MVKETQGITSLRWPSESANVGDLFTADDTNISYELMPNLRWRNVVAERFYDNWVLSENPENVQEGENVFGKTVIGFPSGTPNPNDGPITLYNEDTIQHMDRLFQININGSDTLPEYRQLYLSSAAAVTAYHITSYDDVIEGQDLPPSKPPLTGWDWWTWGKNLAAFNRPHRVQTAIPLVDYVQDPSRMSEVRVKVDWKNSNGLPVTVGNHIWTMSSYEFERASKNYMLDITDRITTISEDVSYPNNPPVQPERSLSTDWIDLEGDSNYLWWQLSYNPGQLIGGMVLTIDDPSYTGNDGSASTSGMCMDATGKNIYFVRNSTGDDNATMQKSLTIAGDLKATTDIATVTEYTDLTRFPTKTVDAGNCCITEDGREFFISDLTDNKVKQWKLRTNFQISDIGSYDPYNSWDYADYYKEFQVVTGNILDIYVNRAKASLLVLTDNNKITKYTFTGDDISTAVYDSELDISTYAAGAKCFTLTFKESSIVLLLPEGIVYAALEAGIDLTTVKWKPDVVPLLSNDPRGVAISEDGMKLFVADNQTENPTLRLSQWEVV